MHFQFETNLSYHNALKRARRQIKMNEKQGNELNPKELNVCASEIAENDQVELGVMEIPVDQIVGVAESLGRELYTSDFMPISSANSNYAYQWRALYMDYRNDKEFLSPIYCYEYLGKFYIIDGKKRVSVLKYLGAPTVSAFVTRILPALSEEEHIQIYYEFLKAFELTKLYQLSFSQLGSFEKLQQKMKHEADQAWSDEERKLILQDLKHIAPALESAFGNYLNVTPADALLVLLEERSFEQIRKMPLSAMTDLIQRKWKELYSICHPDIYLGEEEKRGKAS